VFLYVYKAGGSNSLHTHNMVVCLNIERYNIEFCKEAVEEGKCMLAMSILVPET
jgi:hypothetical protein